MDRNLNEFLSEVDEEYKLEIFATYNIQTKEVMDLISHVLFKFDLRDELEKGICRTVTQSPKEFPHRDMCPVYSVKASVGIKPMDVGSLIQEISAKLKKDQCCFAMKLDDGDLVYAKKGEYEVDLGRVAASDPAKPRELKWYVDGGVDSKDAQGKVGQLRINSLISSLEKAATSKKKEMTDRDKAVMTHLGLKSILGENKKKGYYSVCLSEGSVKIAGPFKDRPDGVLIDTKAKYDNFLK